MQKRVPDKLAIFDFDGTLTTRDTTFGFIFFYAGSVKAIFSLLCILPMVIFAKLGKVKMQTVKEKLFQIVLGGHAMHDVKIYGDLFSSHEIPLILHPVVYPEMKKLHEEGFEILLLSASCSLWLEKWCEREKIRLLCSELEVENGCYTGNLKGRNCYGEQKVVRLREVYDLNRISEIVAYGNHHSDSYYMKLAHKSFMVNGRNILPYE